MKKVALFGGSFNPPHEGHFEMAKHIRQALDVDEVWFLFSVNWQKDPSRYAAIGHRMEMGRIMADHYPGLPFVMSDIEDELGTHITHDVLTGLQQKFPDHRFVWVMGADNLASFHTWEHFDSIMENFPVAVVNRPSYTEQALQSHTALTYPHLKTAEPKDLTGKRNGWCFIDTPPVNLSSTALLNRLRAGERAFGGPFQDVVDYIVEHGLYGVDRNAAPSTGKNPGPA